MKILDHLFDSYVHQQIQRIPEYLTVKYCFDWVSVLILCMLIYTIPSVYIFMKTVIFYFTNRSKIVQVGLRTEMFQAFLLMQFWDLLLITADFLTFRIPYTKLLTSYCISENPYLLKLIPSFYYLSFYTSKMFTVMFCGIRVAILFSVPERDTKKIVNILTFVIIFIGFILTSPHYFSEAVCIQMGEPFSLGAILISSGFHFSHSKCIVYANLFFMSFTTFSIIVLTYFMVRKVRERKTISNTFRLSVQTSKMEKTLTTTMFILLVPLILNLSVSIGELFHFSFSSYILLLRPLFLDARVHIVTCYFYLTHPVFKKHKVMISQTSALQNSSRLKSAE